jgi:hypothetical protein
LFVGDNADVTVIDPSGKQTGFDQTAGTSVQEIPDSVYFRDSEENQIAGQLDTGVSHSVLIPTPALGAYQAIVTGLTPGPYTLYVRTYSTDGTPQPVTRIQGIVGTGSTKTFQIQFASTPGSASAAVPMITFQNVLDDINNSLQLGLIDNAGIASVSPGLILGKKHRFES